MAVSRDDGLSPVDVAAWILCAAAATFGAWALHVGWAHSILDVHPWRQSHTALSAYEMVRGGPFWRYVTPILGPPWSSPLELPLYQWIVAVATRTRGLDLETTGRAVSVAFFGAMLVSYWFALDVLHVRPRYRPVFVALVLVSPLYVFWSRAFMIESTALFFAVTYLLGVHRVTRAGTLSTQTAWLAFALAAGVLGAMVKITTFVPWWTGAAMLAACRLYRRPAPRWMRVTLAVGLIVPVAAAIGWLAFADVVKAANPLSERLAWSTVAWKHFGPLGMRFVLKSWYSVPGGAVMGHTRHTVVASAAVFAAAWVSIALLRGRFMLAVACMALYFLPLAVFMRLYNVHVYYPYANSLFLITVVGCGIAGLLERGTLMSWLGLALLTAALVAPAMNYLRGYYVDQQSDNASHWPLAWSVRAQVPQGDVLLIYGLDLSTEFTYTAQRRSIMDWENRGAGDPGLERSFALMAEEGSRIGALVACSSTRNTALVARTAARLALAERPSYRDSYCDVYFPRDRMPVKDIALR